ncbi:hypothetical protein ACTXJO_04495 [Psychrobacter celer]|uniref:hypothetical protein n=1 Tax=Psychrobacter celer TaxID=306572 RepID=UPI003FD59314
MTMQVLMLTGDTSHVSGQVGIGQSIIEVPSFEVAVGLCQKEREQLLLDKALEISPDLSLTRADSMFWQPVKIKA